MDTGVAPTLLPPPLDLPAGAAAWSAVTNGYNYADGANADGLQKATFKSSLLGRAKMLIKGKGANLPDPTLPLTAPVTVQLVNDTPGACWEATYDAGDVRKASPTVFKAKFAP